MKYILLCLAVLVACLGCPVGLAIWIGRAKKLKRSTMLMLAAGFSLILICAFTFGYLGVYYRADATAEITSPTVQMTKIDGGYFFDGPGEDTALIFYPGAKVETLAYAPLMTHLAEQGVDCFLADMPFRIAFFDSNRADRFLNSYSYENWSVAGHSLGGLVASGYAAEHSNQIQSLILLASYPGSRMPDEVQLCSIYGTQDGCLSREAYEKAKKYWPATACEHVLEGGNHAQYANYGPQSGDLEAGISRDEQQNLTVYYILQFLGDL